jgi:hypothetical protein
LLDSLKINIFLIENINADSISRSESMGPSLLVFLHVGANKPIVAGTVPGSFKSSAISNDYGNN